MVKCVRDFGVPLGTTSTSLVHCRDDWSELSNAAVMPQCCAIVRPRLECATEANSPNPRAYINHPEWVQHLAALSTQLLLTGTKTPPSWHHPGIQRFQRRSWPKSLWFLPSSIPHLAERANLQNTAMVRFLCRLWNTGTHNRRLLSCHPQCLSLKSSWVVNFPKSFLKPQTVSFIPERTAMFVNMVFAAPLGQSSGSRAFWAV